MHRAIHWAQFGRELSKWEILRKTFSSKDGSAQQRVQDTEDEGRFNMYLSNSCRQNSQAVFEETVVPTPPQKKPKQPTNLKTNYSMMHSIMSSKQNK